MMEKRSFTKWDLLNTGNKTQLFNEKQNYKQQALKVKQMGSKYDIQEGTSNCIYRNLNIC
jgi:hypothetical protein